LLRAAPQLCDVDVAELRKRAPLRASFFDELVAPNLDRDVLRWLDDPDAFRIELHQYTPESRQTPHLR
ncbi:hypothetical protein LCGC14_1992800, partial [marine sediment metagenome]